MNTAEFNRLLKEMLRTGSGYGHILRRGLLVLEYAEQGTLDHHVIDGYIVIDQFFVSIYDIEENDVWRTYPATAMISIEWERVTEQSDELAF